MAYTVPRPEKTSYVSQYAPSVIEIPLDGGASRIRQDLYFPDHIVNAQWLLKADEYAQFMGYFRTELRNGAVSFLLDLIIDIAEPTLHECKLIEGLPKLIQQKGDAFYVSANLMCSSNPTYTGLIAYQEEGRIVFTTTFPFLVGPIVTGDSVRVMFSEGIHPTGSTPLNLDGVYIVSGTTGFNVLTLTSPSSVNSDWTVLAGLGVSVQYGDASNGNVISTVTRVPT